MTRQECEKRRSQQSTFSYGYTERGTEEFGFAGYESLGTFSAKLLPQESAGISNDLEEKQR